MKTLLEAARRAALGRGGDEAPDGGTAFGFLSIERMLPIMVASAVAFVIVLLLAVARIITGAGETGGTDARYAIFFGLLVPSALAVGLALRLGTPSVESIRAERREAARARDEWRRRHAKAEADAHAARIEAQAHAARSRAMAQGPLPKSLARRETAQHDALDFLVDRRRNIEKALAKRNAEYQAPAPGEAREDRVARAAAARSLFLDPKKAPGRPERYEAAEKKAEATIKRVA